MISYFIVAHCTFTTNFSSELKSQFQVIFDQDFFPLKMSPFQVRLLHNFMNCLLANGWWNTCFSHYSFFTKKFPISSRKHLLCHKIFLFCRTTKSPIFFSICLQLVAFEYSMISYLIFLNKVFLHLDADSVS